LRGNKRSGYACRLNKGVNKMPDEMVTITKIEYDELLEDSKILSALQGAGVDNWQGYDDAMQSLSEE
jgi:phage pi2 protein 07